MMFGILPYLSPQVQPFVAVILNNVTVNSFIVSFMCFTSYLPIIARAVHQAHLDNFNELPTESDPLLTKPIDPKLAIDAPSALSMTIAKITSVASLIDCIVSVVSGLLLQWALRRWKLEPCTCVAITGVWWILIGTISTLGLPGSADSNQLVAEQPVDHKPIKKQSTFQLIRSLKRLPQMRKLLGAHIIACDCECASVFSADLQ
jgi:urea transporter